MALGAEEGRDKRRNATGAVSKQRAVDIRMGEPTAFKRAVRESEVTQGTETSKYL